MFLLFGTNISTNNDSIIFGSEKLHSEHIRYKIIPQVQTNPTAGPRSSMTRQKVISWGRLYKKVIKVNYS